MQIKTIVGGSIGTNCYVISDNEKNSVLVDYVPEAEPYISKNSLIINKVFLTHIHFDHIEYLSLFQKKKDFDLYLSEYAYKNINDPEKNLVAFTPFMDEYEKTDKINLSRAILINDNDIIEWNNRPFFKVLLSPGHSPDSVIYISDEIKSVFSGDTLFHLGVGRTDFPGSSHEKMLESSIIWR